MARRGDAIQKTIHGKPVTQDEFRREIVKIAKRHPATGATMPEIAEALGPEWAGERERAVLSSNLRSMKNSNLLTSRTRGYWQATKRADKGVSSQEQDERAILDILRDNGGFARHADIMEAFGVRPHGMGQKPVLPADATREQDEEWMSAMALWEQADLHRTSTYRHLHLVIKKSSRIRQDLGERGLYNLPWDELAQTALSGRALSRIIKHTFLNFPDAARAATEWANHRDNVYLQIGSTFRTLLAIRGVDDLAVLTQDDGFSPILEAWARGAPEVANHIVTLEAEREARRLAEQSLPEIELNEKLSDRRTEVRENITLYLLAAFGAGEVMAHYSAPAAFYREIGEAFDIDAAQFSRGIISITPPETRARPSDPMPEDVAEFFAKRESEPGLPPERRVRRAPQPGRYRRPQPTRYKKD